MQNISLALDGAWKVLLAGLILGAGLPVIFAAGVKSMAFGTSGESAVDGGTGDTAAHPIGKVLATVCFLVVLAGVAIGIAIVVASGFNKAVSFEHIYPTFVSK